MAWAALHPVLLKRPLVAGFFWGRMYERMIASIDADLLATRQEVDVVATVGGLPGAADFAVAVS